MRLPHRRRALLRLASGLRARLLRSVCVALVPVVGLILLWAVEESGTLRRARAAAAMQSARLDAAEIEGGLQSVLAAANALAALPGLDSSKLCRVLSDATAPPDSQQPGLSNPGPAGVALIDLATGRPLCAVGLGVDRSGGAFRALGQRLAAGDRPALARDADVPAARMPGLLMAVPVGRAPTEMLVVRLPRLRLDSAKAAGDADRPDGALVVDGGGKEILRIAPVAAAGQSDAAGMASDPPDAWVPRDPAALLAAAGQGGPGGIHSAEGRGGRVERYAAVPLGRHAGAYLLAYEARGLFSAEQRHCWRFAACFVAIAIAMAAGMVWAVDRMLMRWVLYLRRIAMAHARGRWSVRAGALRDAPAELRALGRAIDRMAENMSGHARRLEATIGERDALLKELHHRVKNNFQVIASLLSLHKKSLPRERWHETRFLEEHVRVVAIAYRTAYASANPKGVAAVQLIAEVVQELRENAGIPTSCVCFVPDRLDRDVDLDKATALALYFAYFLPPYLDGIEASGRPLTIEAHFDDIGLTLELRAMPPVTTPRGPLQTRLAEAYLRQLGATRRPLAEPDGIALTIPLKLIELAA